MIGPESELWDVLRVGNVRSPGVVTISGADLKYGWDAQKGATTSRINEPLKRFDAEFYIVNSQDDLGITEFDLWDPFQDLLESSVAGAEPDALEVYHPVLARNHITAVTVSVIGQLVSDGRGGAKAKVSFMEYRPPKPARVGGAGKVKSPNSGKTETDYAIDAKQAELKALQTEYKTL
jgi:hypothetical protein